MSISTRPRRQAFSPKSVATFDQTNDRSGSHRLREEIAAESAHSTPERLTPQIEGHQLELVLVRSSEFTRHPTMASAAARELLKLKERDYLRNMRPRRQLQGFVVLRRQDSASFF